MRGGTVVVFQKIERTVVKRNHFDCAVILVY